MADEEPSYSPNWKPTAAPRYRPKLTEPLWELRKDHAILPISTRLAGILEMAKLDPAGKQYAADKYVFGEVGEQVKNTKRAWSNACTRAGVADLHFHDLRTKRAHGYSRPAGRSITSRKCSGTRTCHKPARI